MKCGSVPQQVGKYLFGTLQRFNYAQEVESNIHLRYTSLTGLTGLKDCIPSAVFSVWPSKDMPDFPLGVESWVQSIPFPQALVRNINILWKSNCAKHFCSLLLWETTNTGLCQIITLCKHPLKACFAKGF